MLCITLVSWPAQFTQRTWVWSYCQIVIFNVIFIFVSMEKVLKWIFRPSFLYFYITYCNGSNASKVVCGLLLLQGVFGVQSYGMSSQYGWNKAGFVHSQQPMPMANYGSSSSSSGQPNAPYCGGQSRFMQPGMGGSAGSQCRPSSLGYNSQFNSMQNYPVGLLRSPTMKYFHVGLHTVFTTSTDVAHSCCYIIWL